MENQRYSDMILKIVEKTFNKIIIGISVALIVLSIVIFASDINNRIAYSDMAAAILFMSMIFGKVSIHKKVIIVTIISFSIASFVFLGYGFVSTTTLLLVFGSLLAVLLLEINLGIIFSVISLGIFLMLWFLSAVVFSGSAGDIGTAKWIAQIIAYSLYLFVLNGLGYVMRTHLIKNMRVIEESNEKIYELAYYDNLTQLPNRFFLKEQLSNEVNFHGYLVLFKIKNINKINKLYSESFGDTVIVKIADVLTNVFTESKQIARVNGNEFVVWMDSVDDIQSFLEKKIKSVNQQVYFPNVFKQIEFNISCLYCSEAVMDTDDCYNKLHLALHYVKNINEVVYYTSEFKKSFEKEKLIEEKLEKAVKKSDFEMHYQGKVDSRTELVYGVEALARWKNKDIGFISPGVFIPMIESMNLAVEFGRITVKKVFSDYKKIRKKFGDEVIISINTSPTLLLSSEFSEWIYKTAKEYDVDMSKIIIEITEDVMVEEIRVINDIFRQLKHFGFKTSLDDFGKGYSSLNYLVELEIDEIKIDKGFIDRMLDSKKATQMIGHVIKLSKELGIDIVAEGVETKEQVDALAKLNCFSIQGYYYSKPGSIR